MTWSFGKKKLKSTNQVLKDTQIYVKHFCTIFYFVSCYMIIITNVFLLENF